jgi:hypothetical protein
MTLWLARDNVIYCRLLTSQVTGLSRPRGAPGHVIGDASEPSAPPAAWPLSAPVPR